MTSANPKIYQNGDEYGENAAAVVVHLVVHLVTVDRGHASLPVL